MLANGYRLPVDGSYSSFTAGYSILDARCWMPEGITAAIKTFYAEDKKISLYVFGDEFSGSAIQPVIEDVDRINKTDRQGQRRVRIHAVGFPVLLKEKVGRGNTGERFATLMRILCYKNGGTFVGLNSTRP